MEKWKCPDCGKDNEYDLDKHGEKCLFTDCTCGYREEVWGVPGAFHIKNSIESDRDWGKDMNPTEQCRRIDEIKQWKD